MSSRWPKQRRRADVSHTIHKVLASIPDEQERFEAVTNPPPNVPHHSANDATAARLGTPIRAAA
ncbi:DUF6192 family protein [Streptomyces sp. NPDC005281]|uniref:DUF6192 family protein n=1 Tax=Streptomyces sp. NPDC005281 TaxID=3155712 RepID=UPI0033A75204